MCAQIQQLSLLRFGLRIKPASAGPSYLITAGWEPLDKSYGPDGLLAKRLAGLAYLISRLPTDPGADIGVRATPDHLADLLIDDLTIDQGAFRTRVRALIDRMVDDGHLIRIGEEVRIQTTEGRVWQQEFQKARIHFGNDLSAIADQREKLIEGALGAALRQVSAVHGDAKVPCKLVPHRGDRAPERDGRNVPLWVRDGWRTTAKEARDAARTMGSADGTVHVFVDKPSNNDLKDAIADLLAAKATLEKRGLGHGASGEEARRGMETRQRVAQERAVEIAQKLVDDAVVLLGGGTTENQAMLVARLESAVDTARKRLFSQFKAADRPAVRYWAAGTAEQAYLFSLRSAELRQGFFMQSPNLSQVPLGFFNVVPDGVQLLPDRNLASISQRGFEALKAKCGKSGEGISLLYSLAGRHDYILEFGSPASSGFARRHPPAQVAEALPFLRAEGSSSRMASRSLG